MKLKNLTINNFKATELREIPLHRLNFLIGSNGSGKTTVMEALRYLLSGILPSDSIRRGQECLHVAAVVDDGHDTLIERYYYVSDRYMINGSDVKEDMFHRQVAAVHEAAYQIGTDLEVIKDHTNPYYHEADAEELWSYLESGKCPKISGIKELEVQASDGTAFYIRKGHPAKVALNGKKVALKVFNQYLQNLVKSDLGAFDVVTSSDISVSLDMGDFSQYLMKILPVTTDFDTLCKEAAMSEDERKIIAPLLPVSPAPVSLQDIQSAYKYLYEARREQRKSIEYYAVKANTEEKLPAMTAEEIARKLESLQQQYGAMTELKKAHSVYEQTERKRAEMEATVARWTAEKDAITILELKPGMKEHLSELLDATLGQIKMANSCIASYKESIINLNKMLSNLNTSVCPICETLECKTDKSICKNDLQQSVARFEAEIAKCTEHLAGREQYRERLERNIEKVNENDRNIREKAALEKRIKEYRNSMPSQLEKPAPVPDQGELEKQILELQSMQRAITICEEASKSAQKYRSLKAQYMLYDRLVKKSDPKKGILSALVVEHMLAPFNAHCNSFVTSVYADMQIHFRLENNGLSVYCRPHGKSEIVPVNRLSTGERTIALLSLMDMVACHSGVRILAFDNMETVDESGLKALLSALSSCPERYDHVFFSAVGHKSIVDAISTYRNALNVVEMVA